MPRRMDEVQAVQHMRTAGLEPLEPYTNVETPWRCRCEGCGDIVSPRLHNVRAGWGGCRPCSVKSRVAKQRKGNTARAVDDMRAAGLEPLEPFVDTKTDWRCRCMNCGAVVGPKLNNIRSGHGGCIDCGGKAPVDPDVAVADMLAADLKPLEPYSTALTRWRSRCLKCGNVVEVRLAGVRNGNAGCLHCGRAGFALRGPAILYLITHRGHRAHKIGIMGQNAVRLDRHNRQGWATFETFSFVHYVDAYRVEQGVLRLLRTKMGITSYLSSEDISNGWTETIDARLITLTKLRALVHEVTTRITDERRRFRRQQSNLTRRRSGPMRTDGFEVDDVSRPPITSWTHWRAGLMSQSFNASTGSCRSRRMPNSRASCRAC